MHWLICSFGYPTCNYHSLSVDAVQLFVTLFKGCDGTVTAWYRKKRITQRHRPTICFAGLQNMGQTAFLGVFRLLVSSFGLIWYVECAWSYPSSPVSATSIAISFSLRLHFHGCRCVDSRTHTPKCEPPYAMRSGKSIYDSWSDLCF